MKKSYILFCYVIFLLYLCNSKREQDSPDAAPANVSATHADNIRGRSRERLCK